MPRSLDCYPFHCRSNTIRLGKRNPQQESTRKWVDEARDWSALQKSLLSDYFEQLNIQAERRQRLKRLISQAVCEEPLMLSCMKLLGIGIINAFALLAVIGDVRRFDRSEKLVAYLGLNPGQRTSGNGKRVKLGVGNRGRSDMRALITQSAQAVLRMGAATPLGKWGWKLFARKGVRNTAVAAVARKLVVQVWHLLSGNQPTEIEKNKSVTIKLRKLAVTLGKSLRNEMGLTGTLEECVEELQKRIPGVTNKAVSG